MSSSIRPPVDAVDGDGADAATEQREWWETAQRVPGVGVGFDEAVKRRARELERQRRRADRDAQRRQERALPRRRRRAHRRAAQRAKAQRDAGLEARQNAINAALRRFERADEPESPIGWAARAFGGSMVPLAAEQRPHVSTTRNVAAIFPFYNEEGLGSRGVLVGLNVTGGGAFCWDPWNLYSRTARTREPSGERAITNGNMIVVGVPGSGKSALVKCLGFRQAAFGRRLEAVDPKGEYDDVVAALGGVTLRLEPGGPQALNPLSDVGDPRARGELLKGVAQALLGRSLRTVERAGLLAALTQADTWDRQAVSINVSAIERLGAVSGAAGQNVPLAVTIRCCRAFLDARARQRAGAAQAQGRIAPKTLRINDEGWGTLAVPGQAEQYQSDWKLQRASGVVNVLVMHRFSDLRAVGDDGTRARELAEGLLSDSDTKVIYRQDEAQFDDLRQKAELTDAECDTIRNLEPGQALWIVGTSRMLVQHLRSSYEIGLSDTDQAMASGLPDQLPPRPEQVAA